MLLNLKFRRSFLPGQTTLFFLLCFLGATTDCAPGFIFSGSFMAQGIKARSTECKANNTVLTILSISIIIYICLVIFLLLFRGIRVSAQNLLLILCSGITLGRA